MNFHITGVNHRTAPVEVREKLAFPDALLREALTDLTSRQGVCEGLILSTCNRVEVVITAEQPDPVSTIEQFFEDARAMPRQQISPHLYHYRGRDAIRHLFRVASSLDSMVVGEPQILGQLKTAYAAAKLQGAVNSFLDTLLTRAFNVAKRVRSETEIGQSAVSVSYAAVELAREIFGNLKGRSVLLIGAGKMSELAARHLRRAGATRIFVSNRTIERAAQMAEMFSGIAVPYERIGPALAETDIAITSSAAPHYVLTFEQMQSVMHQRRNRPLFLIDIAVPRNIEPEVNRLDGIFLYDIDDLGRVVSENRQSRISEASAAERIVEEEVDKAVARLREREVSPTIAGIQAHLEQVRQAEWERIRQKLGPLSPQQEEAIHALTRGLLAKIAHGPIAELRRQAGRGDTGAIIDLVRRMFRMPE